MCTYLSDLSFVMQAKAAVSAELARAGDGPGFARLAWLVEDLVYDDLLKGTGWGRRRGWCRERLEECRTLAQARAHTSAHGGSGEAALHVWGWG